MCAVPKNTIYILEGRKGWERTPWRSGRQAKKGANRPREESGHIPHLTGLPEAKAARQDSPLSVEHQDSLFMTGAGSFCQFHGAENKCYAWGFLLCQATEGREANEALEMGLILSRII